MSTAIFYVDDDQDDLDLFKGVADELGHPTALFNNGNQLLDAVKNPPPKPTLVFIDLNMPIINGFEVLEQLKELNPENIIPVVVLTTANDLATVDRCHKLGARMFVKKPNSITELRETLKKVAEIEWDTFPTHREAFVFKK